MAKSRKIAGFRGMWVSILLVPAWIHILWGLSFSGPGGRSVSLAFPDQIQYLADSLERSHAHLNQGIEIRVPFEHYQTHPLRNPDDQALQALDKLVHVCQTKQIPYGMMLELDPPPGLRPDHIRPGYLLTSLAGWLIRHESYPPAYLKFRESWFQSSKLSTMVATFAEECHAVPAFRGILVTDVVGKNVYSEEDEMSDRILAGSPANH
ncbi:MAG: hypothetical protein AAFV07_20135 [Bacteroidota bacterium]